MMTLGEKIAQLRKERSMTQEDLACAIGVSSQSVSKWENNNTMPDIMLLPVIAGIFETSIDALFSENVSAKAKTLSRETAVNELYKAHLENMQRFWAHGDSTDEQMISQQAEVSKAKLANAPTSHTGIVAQNGAIYANHALALTYTKSKEESLSLLDSTQAADFLRALSDETFRKILKYQLENPAMSFTAASVAVKCKIDEADAEKALNDLVNYNFMSCQNVDVGTDKLLSVYHLYGEHKMNLLVYPILHMAAVLSDFHESWYGFSG